MQAEEVAASKYSRISYNSKWWCTTSGMSGSACISPNRSGSWEAPDRARPESCEHVHHNFDLLSFCKWPAAILHCVLWYKSRPAVLCGDGAGRARSFRALVFDRLPWFRGAFKNGTRWVPHDCGCPNSRRVRPGVCMLKITHGESHPVSLVMTWHLWVIAHSANAPV